MWLFMSQSQKRIQDFFRTVDSTTPVTDSSMRSLTNTLKDLHLPAEGQALPRRNEAESQPGSETQSETDEFTDLHDTATSTIATSTSLCRMSCEYQCCSNVSTPHHHLAVDRSKRNSCVLVNSMVSRNHILGQFKVVGMKLILGSVCVHQNIKCILQPAEQLLSKVC